MYKYVLNQFSGGITLNLHYMLKGTPELYPTNHPDSQIQHCLGPRLCSYSTGQRHWLFCYSSLSLLSTCKPLAFLTSHFRPMTNLFHSVLSPLVSLTYTYLFSISIRQWRNACYSRAPGIRLLYRFCWCYAHVYSSLSICIPQITLVGLQVVERLQNCYIRAFDLETKGQCHGRFQ